MTVGTRRTYEREWETWVNFIESEEVRGKGADPFLRDIASDVVKSYSLRRLEGVRGYKSDCGHQRHVSVWRA